MDDINQNLSSGADKVRRAFETAAPAYDMVAALQREVNRRLLSRLDYIKLQPDNVVDLGAGTGTASRVLQRRYAKSTVYAVDFALPMLSQLQRRSWWRAPTPICANIQALPFRDKSVDLILSSLTLQWCNNLPLIFKECRRVLKPGGALLFATLGPDTLRELRTSWAAVDSYQHVNHFTDMHDIGDALLGTGFADPVLDIDYITMTYSSLISMLRELKALGANTVIGRRNGGLTGKQTFDAMCRVYDKFRTDRGLYPATYEVVYGLAWERAADVKPLHFMGQFS